MIPVFKPCLDSREAEAVRKVLESGWIGQGPKVEEFEEKFAAYVGSKYAVAVSSGTAALHLALYLAHRKKSYVFSSPLTFISTNLAIVLSFNEPFMVDIESDTLNIDPNYLQKLSRPGDIFLPVHYGGHPCDMGAITRIAKEKKCAIIEDCAHACGARYNGKHVGTFGLMGCFSFHAVKNMTTGEGGMIVTDNKDIYERLKRLRWCGISKDTYARKGQGTNWRYIIDEIGYKYQMSDINAAIGIVQLEKLDQMNFKRGLLWNLYNTLLADEPEIETPIKKDYAELSYHNYVIKYEYRDELHDYLATRGIDTSVHYEPNNHYPIFTYSKGLTPVSEEVWKKILTLPLFPDLERDQVHYICEHIKKFLMLKSQEGRLRA